MVYRAWYTIAICDIYYKCDISLNNIIPCRMHKFKNSSTNSSREDKLNPNQRLAHDGKKKYHSLS